MDVYVVLWNDRHADPETEVFDTLCGAALYVWSALAEWVSKGWIRENDIDVTDLSNGRFSEEWMFSCSYSCESDNIDIRRRSVHITPGSSTA